MAVTGFLDINAYVTNPKGGDFAPFRYCLLQEKLADGEPLIVSIEDKQPGVTYLVFRRHMQGGNRGGCPTEKLARAYRKQRLRGCSNSRSN
eukprot:13092878-Ditylum_brightwellii.AAC.1